MLLKEDFVRIVSYVFNFLLIGYLLLLLSNQLFSFSVDNILSLNYILFLVVCLGIMYLFLNKDEKLYSTDILKIKHGKKEIREYKMEGYDEILSKDYSWVVYLIAFLSFFIIKIKTYSLGWVSWVISIIAGILTVLLSLLISEEEVENNEK